MNWVALRMLTGDRSKYLGIIFGVTFATLLMAQQMSIFTGIMARTGSQIGRASCRERGVDLGGRRIIKKKKREAHVMMEEQAKRQAARRGARATDTPEGRGEEGG